MGMVLIKTILLAKQGNKFAKINIIELVNLL